MKRITLVGNAGGGKSTLARRLGRALSMPVFELDAAEWQPGWVRTPPEAVARQHAQWLDEPTWIIEGWGSDALMAARFETADTIVVVDHAFAVHVAWVLKRYVSAKLGRSDNWPPTGCSPRLAIVIRLLWFMWRVDRDVVPALLKTLQDEPFRSRVIHLRSPQQMHAWEQRVVRSHVVRGTGVGSADVAPDAATARRASS
jgi:adenylate kinase family enzyme